MFEIGMRVVCTKPAEAEWFLGIPPEFCPTHMPVTGGIYTIRDIVMGAYELDGKPWTEAPGIVGLIFHEIRNEPTFTTNGRVEEQSFHEDDFMPLDGRTELVD